MPMVSSQRLKFTSSLNDQREVHRGDGVTFRCITVGSTTLAWSGDDYIGGRIEFMATETGAQISPNNFTSVELVDVYSDVNGRCVMESQLSIIVQKTIRSTSVTCHHVGSGISESISFHLSGKCTKNNISVTFINVLYTWNVYFILPCILLYNRYSNSDMQ